MCTTQPGATGFLVDRTPNGGDNRGTFARIVAFTTGEEPMTRLDPSVARLHRGALAVLTLVVILAAPVSANADDSWVGKTILVKKAGIRIGQTDEKDPPVYVATLHRFSYKVVADK